MSTPAVKEEDFTSAINLLGDAYILHIIEKLSTKGLRFNELQRSITDICPATLTDRLKKLEVEAIVIRREETVDKVSVVYELTQKGKGVLPIIKAINMFAKDFINTEK
jgi:DNA-binding HxlR family transcriptional regulator